MAVQERELSESGIVTIDPGNSIRDAAEIMERQNVGCLVVVDNDEKPVGILTDRDLALKVLDDVANIDGVDVRDVMTKDPVTVEKGSNILNLFKIMANNSVRRLPITEDGRVINIITFDDMIRLLAGELGELADVLSSESSRKNIRDFF
ncbi:MAG: cyclic nucleotide-binding/CBS domain-containing protein [bacterium]